MIAADSSSLSAFLSGDEGRDVDLIEKAFLSNILVLPPVVLTEILSARIQDKSIIKKLNSIFILEVFDGYWNRAGLLRAEVLKKGYKARLGDALIAQSCIDHKISLVTRDKDFRHFIKAGGLEIIK